MLASAAIIGSLSLRPHTELPERTPPSHGCFQSSCRVSRLAGSKLTASKAKQRCGSTPPTSSICAVFSDQQPHYNHQQQQQQQQPQQSLELWQQEGIGAWADAEVNAQLGRLRDSNGKSLPQSTMVDVHRALAAYLSKPCNTISMFSKRVSMAAGIEQLLQCVVDLGFSASNVRKLVKVHPGTLCLTPALVLTRVDEIQNMNGGSRKKAISVLGSTPGLLPLRLDSLQRQFEAAQRISGASDEQAATMLCYHAQFLQLADSNLEATFQSLLDIGYTQQEACRLLTRALSLWLFRPECIVANHQQLGHLLEATSSKVRAFVLRQPTVLQLDPFSAAFAGRFRLWKHEIGRPLESILAAPVLFQVSLKRSAARVAFMQERGHVMTPTAQELIASPEKFRERFGVSEAEFDSWHRKWRITAMGQRYGA